MSNEQETDNSETDDISAEAPDDTGQAEQPPKADIRAEDNGSEQSQPSLTENKPEQPAQTDDVKAHQTEKDEKQQHPKILNQTEKAETPGKPKINLYGKSAIFPFRALENKVGLRIFLAKENGNDKEFVFCKVNMDTKVENEFLRQPHNNVDESALKDALKTTFGFDEKNIEDVFEKTKVIIGDPENYPKDVALYDVLPIFGQSKKNVVVKIVVNGNSNQAYEVATYNGKPKNKEVIRDIIDFLEVKSEERRRSGNAGMTVEPKMVEVAVKQELAKFQPKGQFQQAQGQQVAIPLDRDALRSQIEADLKASNLTPVRFKDGKIVLYETVSWRISLDKGIENITVRVNENGEPETDYLLFNPDFIFISKRLVNRDNGNIFYELTFRNITGEIKHDMISQRDLTSKRKIHDAIGDKYTFSDNHSEDLSGFLLQLLHINEDDIPLVPVYSKMGWKDNYTKFVLGRKKYGAEPSQDEEVEFLPFEKTITDKFVDALTPKGTIKGWLECASGLLKHNSVRMCSYNVVASIILHPLGESSSTENQYDSRSSVGKTTVNYVGMSVFCHPMEFVVSSRPTPTYVERLLNAFHNLPINIEDIQLIHPVDRNIIVYMIGDNGGRGRGTKDTDVQEQTTWKCKVLTSGEQRLTDDSSHGGATVRGRDYEGGLGAEDPVAVRQFYAGVKDNYGVIFELIIRKIIKDMPTLRERHRKCFDEIYNSLSVKGNIANRMASSFAVTLLAGHIYEDVMKEIGGETKKPLDVVLPIVEEIIRKTATETYCYRGLIQIYSDVAVNKEHYEVNGVKPPKTVETYGGMPDINTLEIYISYMKPMLVKAGMNYKSVVDALKQDGLLTPRTQEKGYYGTGNEARVVSIDAQKVWEKYKMSCPLGGSDFSQPASQGGSEQQKPVPILCPQPHNRGRPCLKPDSGCSTCEIISQMKTESSGDDKLLDEAPWERR